MLGLSLQKLKTKKHNANNLAGEVVTSANIVG
jgi:hypothetical protein